MPPHKSFIYCRICPEFLFDVSLLLLFQNWKDHLVPKSNSVLRAVSSLKKMIELFCLALQSVFQSLQSGMYQATCVPQNDKQNPIQNTILCVAPTFLRLMTSSTVTVMTHISIPGQLTGTNCFFIGLHISCNGTISHSCGFSVQTSRFCMNSEIPRPICPVCKLLWTK